MTDMESVNLRISAHSWRCCVPVRDMAFMAVMTSALIVEVAAAVSAADPAVSKAMCIRLAGMPALAPALTIACMNRAMALPRVLVSAAGVVHLFQLISDQQVTITRLSIKWPRLAFLIGSSFIITHPVERKNFVILPETINSSSRDLLIMPEMLFS
jgi:hypothetical protein